MGSTITNAGEYSYLYKGEKASVLAQTKQELEKQGFTVFVSQKNDVFLAKDNKRNLFLVVKPGSIDVGRGGPLEHHEVIFVGVKSMWY
jgi:hypothetical protein